jgi:hypothetical protein
VLRAEGWRESPASRRCVEIVDGGSSLKEGLVQPRQCLFPGAPPGPMHDEARVFKSIGALAVLVAPQ